MVNVGCFKFRRQIPYLTPHTHRSLKSNFMEHHVDVAGGRSIPAVRLLAHVQESICPAPIFRFLPSPRVTTAKGFFNESYGRGDWAPYSLAQHSAYTFRIGDADSCKWLVKFYQNIRYHKPKDSNVHHYRYSLIALAWA